MRVGFAGAGNMAAAMARGWAAGDGGPEAMLFCDLEAERATRARRRGGRPDARRALGACRATRDVLVLAVKPAALDEVADGARRRGAGADLGARRDTRPTRIAEAFPGVPALRVMPNQPVEVRRGVLCYVTPEAMPDELEAEPARPAGAARARWSRSRSGRSTPRWRSCPARRRTSRWSPRPWLGAGSGRAWTRELAGELVAGTLAGTAELLLKRDPADDPQRRRIAGRGNRGGACPASRASWRMPS